MSVTEQQAVQSEPMIGPEQKLPEITPKAIIVSICLIIILAASNAYLGLKVGTTISAAIPAVVISMGLFRLFKTHNVLEINIVQTAASVGEGITAGLAFTVPALIIIGYWHSFHYWTMAGIGISGGILGVFFSIPLRRALLGDKELKFPEGIAVGQVMKVSAQEETSVKPIIYGSVVGGIIGLFQTGFGVFASEAEYWFIKGKSIIGFGMGFSPAVIAAGYICGFTVGLSILIGACIGWFLGVPLISAHYGFSQLLGAKEAAIGLWSYYIRDIGVGTMLVGGLWTLISLFKPVTQAVSSSLDALHDIKKGEGHKILRTEKDIPINYIFWGTLIVLAIVAVQLLGLFSPAAFGVSHALHLGIIGICVAFLLVAGFILSSVSGYFAGLVGATNSPGSGLLVACLLGLSLILLFVFNTAHIDLGVNVSASLSACGLAIIIASFVGAAIVITNESIQDAKAGQIVGGTPWKQQVTLLASVIVAALVLPLILTLLFNAYGIGGVFPRPGMDPSQMLAAPQAGLMAEIVRGVFNHRLPWIMVIIGLGIGVSGIVIDEILKKFNKRLLILGVGLGIYLPLAVSIPIFIGGLLSYLVQKKVHARYGVIGQHGDVHVSKGMHDALFVACGLVAGSTLMGVILAIPFALSKNSMVLNIMPKNLSLLAGLFSAFVTIGLFIWLYKVAVKKHASDNIKA